MIFYIFSIKKNKNYRFIFIIIKIIKKITRKNKILIFSKIVWLYKQQWSDLVKYNTIKSNINKKTKILTHKSTK